MQRLQLFEFNDQPWLPSVLRDAMTGYLETNSRVFSMDQAMRSLVRALTAGLDDGYRWEVRHVPVMPGARLTVLMGLPLEPVADR